MTKYAVFFLLSILVGVGAYIGGAGLITDLGILAAAASILTNEARHQSILNALNSANAIPQAFDVGLTPGEVLTIASAFVSGCNIPDELNFDGLGLEGELRQCISFRCC